MTRISIRILTSALLLPQYVSAFVVPSTSFSFRDGISKADADVEGISSSTSLFAQKKKRRRRKNNPSSSAPAPAPVAPMPITDGDELPDFDLVEDIDVMEAKQKAAASAAVAATSTSTEPTAGVAPTSVNLDTSDPDVLAAMRSSSSGGSSGMSSTKDLLRSRNRELENKLVVNEITEAVPSLGDYITSDNRRNKGEAPGSPGGLGKKAARREARRAAAVEAEQAGTEEEGFLNKLPFFKKKEGEESKSPIKLLEEGTWACIFILVSW
eukprot:CAMPEP_0204635946 /NCGR_PEP_ID=MMETSP0717-20131115/32740_1 /ASSEMBLY_ACC=CAM_ASM_000666 /TAXON_ID=230516 /ORGANISM="Chaetoceros curvisetus" /LENGTH=267 /DNA_ID=CAMNT_0051654867 /DNA_START=40 /DNA_END=840 /DNA_ORIENTATION=+